MPHNSVATTYKQLALGATSLSEPAPRSTSALILGLLFLWYLELNIPQYAYGQNSANTTAPSTDTPKCEHGCCFAPSTTLGGEKLLLRGVSSFRYWGFRVYTGALYAPPTAKTPDAVRGETKKKLILCYHRSLSPEQFQEKSQEVLEETPGLDPITLQPHLSVINSSYVGVKEGDRYAITYDPSSGTMTLSLNEREPGLAVIQSRSFAKAYFGIWLSDYSVGKQFTAELLGDK
jgi:hypothetical protein